MVIVSPIERAFRLDYGCYPYDYYKKRLDHNHTSSEAMAKLQAAIDGVWRDLCLTHKKEQERLSVQSEVVLNTPVPVVSDEDEDDFYTSYLVGSYNPFVD
ncbi:MAG: hypothetical protein PHV18_15130 [Lachnospiraceae bacterium]|nr:hypothetical protein [Lachnospiraceae bacterium]